MKGDRNARRCKHFTGVQYDQCQAGVSYHAVREGQQGKGFRYPCLDLPDSKLFGADLPCDKREWPTVEDEAAKEAVFERMFADTQTAFNAIKADAKGAVGINGSIPCMVCDGGTIHYAISMCNGHIHASCSTAGCVQFMQ